MDQQESPIFIARRSLKRKLDLELQPQDQYEQQQSHRKVPILDPDGVNRDLPAQVAAHVRVLESTFSFFESDRPAAKQAIHALCDLAKDEEIVDLIVECRAILAIVKHLQSPSMASEVDGGMIHFEHVVKKGSASVLGLLVKSEYQDLIVDAGALSHLVDLLKRHNNGCNARAVNALIRRAADPITNLAHENSKIKTLVWVEGGIPPLVLLLEFSAAKVQRAAAGALQTLAFKNDDIKNQILECNALPTLILMLQYKDTAIHYESVGVISNIVHSSPSIKEKVLKAGLQPIIQLLRSPCLESQREAALLLGQFAVADLDCKVHIAQRGAVRLLIEMLQSFDVQLEEMSTFALGRLAQDTHNQAGILAQEGGTLPLLALIDSKHGSLRHNVAFALYGLVENEDNVAELIKAGAIQKLKDGEFIAQQTKDCAAKTPKR